LSYKAAYRLYRSGNFPIPTQQLATGTILVYETPTITPSAALYARVSSQDQKEDLERQLQRLRDYAAQNGLIVSQEITEIGSGLNGHRKKLLKILSNPSVSTSPWSIETALHGLVQSTSPLPSKPPIEN